MGLFSADKCTRADDYLKIVLVLPKLQKVNVFGDQPVIMSQK